MGRRINNKLGFTLIELIIVIAVIGILAAILIPRFPGYVDKANLTACNENRGNLENMYQYLVADGAPGIGGAYVSLSFVDLKTYFETNAGEDFVFSDYICPKDGSITGKLEVDGSKSGKLVLSCDIHSEVFFHSSFNTMSQLKILQGGWKVENGKLVPTVASENRAIFNDSNGKDYTIKVNSKYFSETLAGYGIYYRTTPGLNKAEDVSGYCFQFDPGANNNVFAVRKVINGKEQAAFQSVKMETVMGKDFNVTDPHEIEIKTVGTTQIIKVDGIEVLNFTDTTFTEGSVGLRTWSKNKLEVNEVIIEK